MLLACEPNIDDLVRDRMPSVIGAGINCMNVIGASTNWKLFD